MDIDELKAELDREKVNFNNAKSRIEELRLEIARRICPLKVGETVKYVKGGKEYQGIVKNIHYAVETMDALFPELGSETGWSVSGPRINKTTGKAGKFSFSISSLSHELRSGVWVCTQSIEKFLGI